MPATVVSGGGPPGDSAEGVAAGAGAARVGVVDREALLLDRVGEVDRRALEVGDAHLVDHDLDAVVVAQRVAVEHALVEVELVDQAGAAAGLHRDAQAQVVTTLLLEERADLVRGLVGQVDAVRGNVGGLAHLVSALSGAVLPRWWPASRISRERSRQVLNTTRAGGVPESTTPRGTRVERTSAHGARGRRRRTHGPGGAPRDGRDARPRRGPALLRRARLGAPARRAGRDRVLPVRGGPAPRSLRRGELRAGRRGGRRAARDHGRDPVAQRRVARRRRRA